MDRRRRRKDPRTSHCPRLSSYPLKPLHPKRPIARLATVPAEINIHQRLICNAPLSETGIFLRDCPGFGSKMVQCEKRARAGPRRHGRSGQAGCHRAGGLIELFPDRRRSRDRRGLRAGLGPRAISRAWGPRMCRKPGRRRRRRCPAPRTSRRHGRPRWRFPSRGRSPGARRSACRPRAAARHCRPW